MDVHHGDTSHPTTAHGREKVAPPPQEARVWGRSCWVSLEEEEGDKAPVGRILEACL